MRMNVDDILLMAYVDGELDFETTRAVEAALETDASARAKVAMFSQTSSLLRSAWSSDYYVEQKGLLQSVRRLVRAQSSRRLAMAVAACLVIALTGFGTGRYLTLPASALNGFMDETAEYHEVYAQETTHLAEISAENKTEFQAWLSARLGRVLIVPDLSSAGLDYAGGRLLVVAGKPVAEMIYTRPFGQPIAVCVTLMTQRPESIRVAEHGELRMAGWTDGSFGYSVVGELNQAAIMALATTVASQFSN
jgi:anti-sigma factor RsiW